MTSPISPISSPFAPAVGPNRAAGAGGAAAPSDEAKRNTADEFAGAVGQAISNGLDRIGQLEDTVAQASQEAAVGSLDSVSDFMIATAEAQLATEITVAVRDRAITAFNDIMRMQI